jgi:tetratricopeptide (TPR) repeat protein
MTQRWRLFVVVTVASAVLGLGRLAADEVDRFSTKAPLRGTIVSESASGVVIKPSQTGKAEPVTVPLDDVADVHYDGAAGLALRTAASLERAGEFDKAAEQYEKAAAGGSEFVVRASSFGRVRSLAKRALMEASKRDEALQALVEFKSKSPNSRYHFALHELLGQFHFEKGDMAAARNAFAELEKAPSPLYRMRAANWQGRLLLQSGSVAEARTTFETVASAAAKTDAEKLAQQEARLAASDCFVAEKKLIEAEQLLRAIIEDAPAEESSLQAEACIKLGDLLRNAGRLKDALVAYLQIDLVRCTQKGAHVNALQHIALLWDQLGRPDDAAAARTKLKRLYPNTAAGK